MRPVNARFSDKLVFDDEYQLWDTFVDIWDIRDVQWKRSGTQQYTVVRIGER